MKAIYTRVSTADQNLERQLLNKKEFDFVYMDKCSGSIPFNEREQGRQLWNNKKVTSIEVIDVTRLGRNMVDILNTIQYFTDKKVNIHIKNLGLSTLVDDKENSTAKLVLSLLSSISEYERQQIKERTQQGREIAKLKNKYKGRKRGATMSIETYKTKHFTNIEACKSLLSSGWTITDISRELKITRARIYDFRNKGLVKF